MVLALGLGCTAVAARELVGAARERDQQRFENVARRLETSLTHRLEADITLLRARRFVRLSGGCWVIPHGCHRTEVLDSVLHDSR